MTTSHTGSDLCVRITPAAPDKTDASPIDSNTRDGDVLHDWGDHDHRKR